MIKIPKSLIIGGIKWNIVFDKKVSGGEFYWHTHLIKIDKGLSDFILTKPNFMI